MAIDPSDQLPADPDIAAARTRFVESLWRGFMVVALLSIPLSLARLTLSKWLPIFGYHIGVALLVVALSLAQRRMPQRWQTGLLLGMLWAVGLPGVFTFGLAASGVWWLVLSCLVATTLYSPRIGLAVCLLTGLVLTAAGAGFVGGYLHPAIAADRYLVLPSSWIATIVVTGVFSVLVIKGFGGYARAVERLLVRIKDQRDEIERLSLHDPLTGLPLGTLAADRLQMALHSARRSGRRVALLYIDLDGFKAVNDNFGHDAGDAVLRACAWRLRHALRGEDTVARLGGDEFMAIIGGLPKAAQAGRVAKKLIGALSQPLDHDGRKLSVGASIGIALFPDDGEDMETLRKRADAAMYEAKRKGRSRFDWATDPETLPATSAALQQDEREAEGVTR